MLLHAVSSFFAILLRKCRHIAKIRAVYLLHKYVLSAFFALERDGEGWVDAEE
jgi:hypothetical protein